MSACDREVDARGAGREKEVGANREEVLDGAEEFKVISDEGPDVISQVFKKGRFKSFEDRCPHSFNCNAEIGIFLDVVQLGDPRAHAEFGEDAEENSDVRDNTGEQGYDTDRVGLRGGFASVGSGGAS